MSDQSPYTVAFVLDGEPHVHWVTATDPAAAIQVICQKRAEPRIAADLHLLDAGERAAALAGELLVVRDEIRPVLVFEGHHHDLSTAIRWRVNYTIRSGINRRVVRESEVVVPAQSLQQAREAAIEWVHKHDAYCDDRIDPYVEINSAEPCRPG